MRLTTFQVKDICDRYQSGESIAQLSKEFGVTYQAIAKRLTGNGIVLRKTVRTKRENKVIQCACGCGGEMTEYNRHGRRRKFLYRHSPMRSGGRYINGDGYVLLQAPSHPKSDRDGYVYEHILLAEKALGRYMPPGVEVHHVNFQKGDNGHGNLVICENHAYHFLLHARTNSLLRMK